MIKSRVKELKKKYKFKNIDYDALKTVAEKEGFTVIEFNSAANDDDVQTVIKNLDLSKQIENSRGFTYADSQNRLVFINEDLTAEEKLMVISHELGHIICNHYKSHQVIGRDVQEEHEANEFSHYLLKTSFFDKYKKVIAASLCVALLVTITCFCVSMVKKEQNYYGEFYVTSSGNKYHQKECIHIKNNTNTQRLTEEQFEKGEYTPCKTCLPQ